MDEIIIKDLDVSYHIGVPDEEREEPQRLSITVILEHDISAAAAGDSLDQTIDYSEIARRLLEFGNGRAWKLIETLAVDLADMILREFKPRRITLEIKKFILPQARYAAIRIHRPDH